MLSSLNVSQTGLNAAKIAVENISNNIANENTPGYKKRVVQLSELEQMDSRFTGSGVSSDSAYRVTSQYTYDKYMTENTKANYYDKLSNMIGNVESIFKETDTSGFSADLDRYFQSLENLRTNPNSEIYKTTLKNSGSIIVESLQNLYTSVEKQQVAEKTELNANVNRVNGILQQIVDINEKLEKYDGVSNDLLDKRDQLELELSNYVDISSGSNNEYYELKISGETVISNNTNVRTITTLENNTNQIDKFYYQKLNTNGTFTIQDSLKFDSNNIAKDPYTTGDIVTYKLNNEFEVSVTIGEVIPDVTKPEISPGVYPPLDLNGDGNYGISDDELVRALVFKINTNSDTKGLVTAYNGDYDVNTKLTNDSVDQYLRVESKFAGVTNDFEGRLSVERAAPAIDPNEAIYKNEIISSDAQSSLSIGIFDKEITVKGGMLKSQVDNLSTTSGSNKYQTYLDKLDAFAQTLSDISDSYIKKPDTNDYIYGEAATDAYNGTGTLTSIGLFSGASVKSLTFNQNSVNDLNQDKLDYLSTIQWKEDISFEGLGESTSSKGLSLLEFFRDIKVGISADKENNDFLKETQDNVKQSIQSSYELLTKVDGDEEMLNLIKFQAAYTANAKIVSAIDEMLQTLLNLR